MNIFISYAYEDTRFAFKLDEILENEGYNVYISGEYQCKDTFREIGKGIANADLIISIVSPSSSKNFVRNDNEIYQFRNCVRIPIIPIVLGDHTYVPLYLCAYNPIIISSKNKNDLNVSINDESTLKLDKTSEEIAIKKLKIALATYNEKIEINKQKQKENEKKVKIELSKYIDNVFESLKKNEKNNKRFAFWLYNFSIIALVSTIIISIIFFTKEKTYVNNMSISIIYSVSCLFVIILLISLSKLLFTLAKSFMVESVRCSDRIHAISFGKFFLDAYGSEATREEVIQAFSSWNIDNGGTTFRSQSSEDYDPKLTEIINILKK